MQQPARRAADHHLTTDSLAQLASAEARCTRCPLYRFATQVVPGEGPEKASLVLVGEQPGDSEDIRGKPFVGPAGRILDQALDDAQIARPQVFVTNAVKHFKYEQRGKRRLHKRPNSNEITQCHYWLEQELLLLKPRAVVALGATAARSVLGEIVTITRARKHTWQLEGGIMGFVTIHPSFLLRIQDEADKQREYRAFVADLRRVRASMGA